MCTSRGITSDFYTLDRVGGVLCQALRAAVWGGWAVASTQEGLTWQQLLLLGLASCTLHCWRWGSGQLPACCLAAARPGVSSVHTAWLGLLVCELVPTPNWCLGLGPPCHTLVHYCGQEKHLYIFGGPNQLRALWDTACTAGPHQLYRPQPERHQNQPPFESNEIAFPIFQRASSVARI